jgi:ABC-type transport system substrate-binding protein
MLAIIMVFMMILPLIMYPVSAIVPTSPTGAGGAVQNPNTLIEDTLYGGGPATLDPAAEYDTASAELLQNAYDTLIFFNGEQCGNVPNSGVSNEYLPGLATQVTVEPPPAGAPAYTNFTVDFTIRGTNPATGAGSVPFQTWSRADAGNLTWSQYYLTAQDVAYTFDRILVHAYAFEGSFWLITDALLLQDSITTANLTDPAFTTKLEDAVQYNNTDCWFNIPNVNFTSGTQSFASVQMFNPDGSFNTNFWTATGALPIDYQLNTFFQVWAQQWASIVSYDWTLGYLIPYLYRYGITDATSGTPPTGDEIEWTFNDWNNWSLYFNPSLPTYDEVAGGVTCGTGPYYLESYNPAAGGAYVMTRNTAYWGGWPASWPSPPYPPQSQNSPATKPEGWVDTFEVMQTPTEAQGIANLAAGSADFAPVPLDIAYPLFTGSPNPSTSPLVIDDPTIPGIQCNYPIPELETETFFMNQAIEPTTGNQFGEIDNPGVWTGTGVPANFFADVNIRKMFAWCLNATFYAQDQWSGRGYEPVTCAPDGFPYINASTPTYNINLAEAATYMAAANTDSGGNLTSIGFTIDLMYTVGNSQTEAMMQNLATMINSLGPPGKFHAVAYGPISVLEEYTAPSLSQFPTFLSGYLADYSGLQDFMFPYMDSAGNYAMLTGYSNPTVDALLSQTAYTNNPAVLTADYGELEQIYYNDVPSVTLFVPVGTGFQRDWVQGHYYNPIYPGIYAYNLWKYNAIPGDVAKLGSVNMADVIDALKAFGSYDGQFEAGGGYWPVMQARWNFYADIIGTPREEWTQRAVNMGDIVTILSHFGQVDTPTGSPGGAPYWNGAWNETSGWYGVP